MSNTTNLNLFKHDNPATNTNLFDVETALNENWDKIDTFAGNTNAKINQKIYYYNNVQQMKNDTRLQAGDACQTLGYYTANDGGSGLYKIADDDTLVDDGGSIHALNNGLKAKLIVNENKINVKQFGAKGDDNTDDTNAFSALINYCNANLKNLYIPVGKYRIYNTLPSIYRGLCIIGEDGNRGLWLNENRPLIRDLRTAGTTDYLITYDLEHSSLRLGTSIFNIIFYANNANNLNCINLDLNYGSYETIVENVSFIGFNHALKMNRTDDSTLSHVTINDCGGKSNNSNVYAIEITNTVVIRVLDCLIEHSRWMLSAPASTAQLIVQNCHFELAKHNIGYLGEPPIVIDRGLLIGNNFITRPAQTLATAMNIESLDDVYYFLSINKEAKIVNNHFTTGGSNDGIVDTNKKQGKFLTISSSEDHGNIVLTGNTFRNCAFETVAINIRYIQGVIFSNNVISILIEEASNDNTFKNLFVIDNVTDTLTGADNIYKIQSSLNSPNQFGFIPRLTSSNNLFYRLTSEYWKTSSNKYSSDTYIYNREASSFSKTPTMVIQGNTGFFELEVYDKNTSNMYYRGIITYDIRTGHSTITESANIVKKLEGATINFIKIEDNKMLVQVTDVAKTHLVFRLNNTSRDAFAYKINSYNDVSTNIIYTISDN